MRHSDLLIQRALDQDGLTMRESSLSWVQGRSSASFGVNVWEAIDAAYSNARWPNAMW